MREVQTLEEEQPLVPLPRDVENLADDPRLQNPLQRLERLSTGWFGVRSSCSQSLRLHCLQVTQHQAKFRQACFVHNFRGALKAPFLPQVVMEYDGVVVEDTSDLQRKAWLKVADEESKPPPPQFALRRAEGMKNDQVSFCSASSCFLNLLWGRL